MECTAYAAIRVLFVGMITVTLTGCGTKFAEVKQVGETGVVVTGADVRMGYTHPAQYDDKTHRVKAQRIFCAEPSPDVAKAVQTGFVGDVGRGRVTALDHTGGRVRRRARSAGGVHVEHERVPRCATEAHMRMVRR